MIGLFHNEVPEEFSGKGLGIKFAPWDKKALYLIFKEAINNAAKYAECRNVWIDISMNGSHKIMMSIRDDGKGFRMNGESKGNGLQSMQKREGVEWRAQPQFED